MKDTKPRPATDTHEEAPPSSYASASALAEFNKMRDTLLELRGLSPPEQPSLSVALVAADSSLEHSLSQQLSQQPTLRWLGSCSSSAEAQLLPLLQQKPDVVLVSMATLPTLDAVRSIKNLQPQTQVLIIIAEQDEDSISKALLAGASCYLLHTQLSTHLLESIKGVVHGGAELNTYLSNKVVQYYQRRGTSTTSSAAVAHLSQREREVLACLAKNLSYKEIATELDISVETVRRHCHNIYEKLHVSSRTAAIARYIQR